MVLDRLTVKETPYPECVTKDWLLHVLHSIPEYSENDPAHPEWRPTPLTPLFNQDRDLLVLIKDESDTQSNPTGTFKNRGVHEIRLLYKPFALYQLRRMEKGLMSNSPDDFDIPRFTTISSGNLAEAVACQFAEFDLPPPKVLMDKATPDAVIQHLKSLRLDLYLTDLHARPLSNIDVKRYTNGNQAIDLTSVMVIEPWAVFYDWLTRNEVFNEQPDYVYIPYGSGRLYENFLYHQMKVITDAFKHRIDPRIQVPLESIAGMHLMGAEPQNAQSKATMLTKAFNPFVLFRDYDVRAQQKLGMSGHDSGIFSVPEAYIQEAYEFLTRQGITTSYDGATATALCFYRFDSSSDAQKDVLRTKSHLAINSGEGIVERLVN